VVPVVFTYMDDFQKWAAKFFKDPACGEAEAKALMQQSAAQNKAAQKGNDLISTAKHD
jgi:hypothetical protein